MRSPKGGIVNVALQNPGSLCVNPKTGYLSSKATNPRVLSTLLGETTYFSTNGIEQICLTPSAHGWHRFVAVLAQVYGQGALFFPSYKGGVSFGRGFNNNSNTHKKRGKAPGAPIEGPLLKQGQESKLMHSYLARGTLIVHVVPVYDGREKFKWNTFKDKVYEETIREGSTVMVLFSVKRGGLGDKAKNAGIFPMMSRLRST